MKKYILEKLYKMLASFSRYYLKNSNATIIWITWSVWKTTCRTIISEVIKQLSVDKKVYTSPKNFNSEIGMIFSIFEIEEYKPWVFWLIKSSLIILFFTIFKKPNYDVLILEYWIDHVWDMDFLLTICKPDISIFTKLDYVHVENFNNIEEIWNEKFKLMLNTKKIVYLNNEDKYCKNNFDKIKVNKKYYFWWDITIDNYDLEKKDDKILASLNFKNKIITTNLLWEESANYILLALDISSSLYWNSKENKKLNSEYSFNFDLQPGRFNIFNWINNSILIDSSYNAWPESMKKMIENTFNIRDKLYNDYKAGFVIWDMRELWDMSKSSHEWLQELLDKWDFVYTIWKETKKYLKQNKSFLSSQNAWIGLREFLNKSGDKYIILFKWSQNTIFTEEALKHVLLNKLDITNLVRQEKYWLKNKEKFWSEIER